MRLKKYLAILLTLVMAMSFATISAFADPIDTPIQEYGQSDKLPPATINKNVTTEKDTEDVPELEYVFRVEQVTENAGSVPDGADSSQSWAIDTAPFYLQKDGNELVNWKEFTIKPTAGDKLTVTNSVDFNPDIDQYKKDSDVYIFGDQYAAIPAQNTIVTSHPEIGPNGETGNKIAIYKFRITEKLVLPNNATAWGGTQDGTDKHIWRNPATPGTQNGDINETLTMSQEEYEMFVYTKNKVNDQGAITEDRYIYAITVKKTKLFNGEKADEDKYNPTPGSMSTLTGDFSELSFENKYKKEIVKDPLNPNDQPMQISKKVVGVNNDPKLLTDANRPKFKFDVDVTKAADDERSVLIGRLWTSQNGNDWVPVVPTQDDIDAGNYVDIDVEVKADGTHEKDSQGQDIPITDVNRIYNDASNKRITKQKVVKFTFDNQADPNLASKKGTSAVELANNEKITFPEAAAGMKFKVVEHDYYTNGVPGSDDDKGDPIVYKLIPSVNGPTTAANINAFTSQSDELKLAARTYDDTLVAGINVANFTNDGKYGTTPAGIIMHYLPFFVIIALAVIALAASVVVKGRRRAA